MLCRHRFIVSGLFVVGFAGSAHLAAGQTVLYVDDDAAPSGDGLAWASAFRFLTDAISEAFAPGHDIVEIRVAQGSYRPDRSELNPSGTGNRFAVFFLVNDVQIKGGYAGLDAPDPDQRDITLHETTLTGDLNGDDGPGFANNAENTYHVVSASGDSGPNRLLDGFTITGGNANGAGTSPSNGGGVFVWPASRNVTLSRCRIVGNRTDGDGGGIYSPWSDPRLIDCTIEGNEAESLGGGMYCEHAAPMLEGCRFISNSTLGRPVAYGGGMYVSDASPTLTGCSFEGNSAAATGGGIYHTDQSVTTLVDTSFRSNAASNVGGIYNTNGSQLTMISCTLIGNSAGTIGGVSTSNDSNLRATNCRFLGNWSTGPGSGALRTSGLTQLTGCLFSGNHTPDDGGAVYCLGSTGTLTLANCSFVGNQAGGEGAGVNLANAFHTGIISNCLFWDNEDVSGMTESAQLRILVGAPVEVSYSSVQAWTDALEGVGNNSEDPLFADADGPDDVYGTDDDDVRPVSASPAIDSGDPDAASPPPETDLDGRPRILCAAIDRGAYEFGAGDFNCDRIVNQEDLVGWAGCATGPDGGPYPDGCEVFDFAYDLDVDLVDFAALQRAFAAGTP